MQPSHKNKKMHLQSARSLSSSHPNPPAPTTRTRAVERGDKGFRPPPPGGGGGGAADGASGSNSPIGRAPVSLANADLRLSRVSRVPRAAAAGQMALAPALPFADDVPLQSFPAFLRYHYYLNKYAFSEQW